MLNTRPGRTIPAPSLRDMAAGVHSVLAESFLVVRRSCVGMVCGFTADVRNDLTRNAALRWLPELRDPQLADSRGSRAAHEQLAPVLAHRFVSPATSPEGRRYSMLTYVDCSGSWSVPSRDGWVRPHEPRARGRVCRTTRLRPPQPRDRTRATDSGPLRAVGREPAPADGLPATATPNRGGPTRLVFGSLPLPPG